MIRHEIIPETYARPSSKANKLAAHSVFGQQSEPGEVANAVAFRASDAASYMTGTALLVDGDRTAIDGPPSGLTQTAPN